MTDKQTNFTHLHVHTEYSLLDGACVIEGLMERVKSLGQTAVAITDHGSMFGCVDFFKSAKKHGIQPIIGCEVYVANRSRKDKVHKLDWSHHMVLLCKNETGYKNLIKLVSIANVEGFYSKPRIDHELLEKYHDGLICLSACLAGEIPQALLAGDKEKARQIALYYKELFGKENFYIEVQDHGLKEQQKILPALIELAQANDIPLVATNDAHYLEKEDNKMQRLLICIQTGKTLNDEDKLEFGTDEFYIKSTQEMYDLFSIIPQACENTNKIAQMCNFEFKFGETKLPVFQAPNNMSNTDYFVTLCQNGLKKYYGETPTKKVVERLEYEISIIDKMGFINYYLIVFDFINFAKNRGIPVGPGRGSGAGSLAAFCMGITGVDPIKYNLLFERFLNPERVSMPDFDIDFCYERRQEVIDYVVAKYGSDHVAQIITFGTMAARGAIRDVGRVMELPYQTVDTVAKLVPTELKMTLKKALKVSKEFALLYDSDPKIKELIDVAIKIEGMPRHSSTHAAGVVITPKATQEFVPLSCNDGQIITQYTMTTIEELGLLKMDFLGLRTLTVISDAEKLVQKTIDKDFSIDNLKYEDKDVFEMLSNGDTSGTFQFESSGMRQVLLGLKPLNVEDLIAVISLYRPGPMDSIPTYIRNRHNPEKITYKHPSLEHILSVTNGCIVYQEQVMQIFRELAGFSYGQADLVRRAMSKKKHDVMQQEGENFIQGCVKNGVPKNIAKDIYDEMSSFASYAFNKSHAAAYAVVAYQTAYLKCHYQKQFMAALLTSVLDNTDKVIEYTAECQRLGLKILPPDINKSDIGFTVENDNLRFGLLALKNVGSNLIRHVVATREDSKYVSLYDFCKRLYGTEINKRAIESFVKSGAMDSFEENRNTMVSNIEGLLKSVEGDKRRNLDGQISFFGLGEDAVEDKIVLKQYEEYSPSELLQYEKEISGLYLSGHPLDEYRAVMNKIANSNAKQIAGEDGKDMDGKRVVIPCTIVKSKYLTTKSNSNMAFLTVEDLTGTLEVVVFPKVMYDCNAAIKDNNVVVVRGRVSVKEDEPAKILAEQIVEIKEYEPKKLAADTKKGLFLKLPTEKGEIFDNVISTLGIFSGDTPVQFYIVNTGKRMLAPRRLFVNAENNTLIEKLKEILGNDCVVLKV